MGSLKSGHSVKSTRSVKSYGSELGRSVAGSRECFQLGFDEYILKALAQFGCPVSVSVFKETQRDIEYLKRSAKPESKFKRKSVTRQLIDLDTPPAETTVNEIEPIVDTHALSLTAYYDFFNRMTEIQMARFKYQSVPRVLMQIIALIVPYYRHLIRFTIKQCCIDVYTIHELKKMLPLTNITDICLDHSPLPEGNYDILLSDLTCLRNLSLARCNINDVVCGRIAARLCYFQPAENTLTALNLSSNDITNEGTKSLAEALRTNRHLRYLNLADNHIDDEGASHILNVLKQFPLTTEENKERRKRYVTFLKKKIAIYYRCLEQILTKSQELVAEKKAKRGVSKKNKLSIKKEQRKGSVSGSSSDVSTGAVSMVDIAKKARVMSEDLQGAFEDPYPPVWMRSIGDKAYCNGNLTLCYLNFAYNNLTLLSTRLLLDVVLYQQKHKTDKMGGLLNVVLDGNYIPEVCDELKMINEVLKAYFDMKVNTERRRLLPKPSIIR